MPGIILSTQCERLVNKGGGYPTKTVTEEVKDPFGRKHKYHKHYEARKKLPGTDYVIFNCPGCGKRNKRSAYEVKGSVGNMLSFKCNGCRREIEVARTTAPVPNIIVAPTAPAPLTGILDARGRPIHAGR